MTDKILYNLRIKKKNVLVAGQSMDPRCKLHRNATKSVEMHVEFINLLCLFYMLYCIVISAQHIKLITTKYITQWHNKIDAG